MTEFASFSEVINKHLEESVSSTSVGINGAFIEVDTTDVFVEPSIKTLSKNQNRFAQAVAENDFKLSRFVSQKDCIILVGGPGTGKSTILKYIALAAFRDDLGSKYGIKEDTIPVLVSLAAFNNQKISLYDYVISLWKKRVETRDDIDEFFSDKFRNGQVLLLLDGLNDLSSEKQQNLLNQLNSLRSDYSKETQVIITTRYVPQNLSCSGFDVGYLQDFDFEGIERYAKLIFTEVESNKHKAKEYGLKFINEISRNIELFNLAKNPLFLSILTLLFLKQQQLPHKRIELYDIYLNDLTYNVISHQIKNDEFTKDVILRVLAYVSYNMTKATTNNSFVTESVLKNYIKSFFEKKVQCSKWEALQKMQLFFEQVIKSIGIFTYEPESGGYTIGQYALQEYLAALNICFDLEEYIESSYRGRIRYREIIDMLLPDVKWYDILKLVVEYISTINSNICSSLDVLNYILHKEIIFSDAVDSERIILAGECFVNLELGSENNEDVAKFISNCQNQLLDILTRTCVPKKSQIRAMRVLAHIGDPRLEDYLDIPEFVDVQPGSFIKGASEDEINVLIEEASNFHLDADDLWIRNYWTEILKSEISEKKEVRIDRMFKISKYPITNSQYQKFLNENPTYNIPGWGDDKKGALYTWDEDSRSCNGAYNNSPVVLVSWIDASNYCEWLSSKTGRKFRLPTEEEWEYAARGQNSKVFPWGDIWKDNYSNTLESGINDITPVGCFPEGKSDFGVFDCAGQIWEWTSTMDTELWKKAWPSHMRSSEDREAYIVRGGAWDDISAFARCSARGPNAPSFYEHYIGFRIVEEV